MSRIGKNPVAIAEGVTVTIADNVVTVKGKLRRVISRIEGRYHCQTRRRML